MHFLHYLLSGAVCVVDLSDIDTIGDNQYGESCNTCNKQYSSKNLSCYLANIQILGICHTPYLVIFLKSMIQVFTLIIKKNRCLQVTTINDEEDEFDARVGNDKNKKIHKQVGRINNPYYQYHRKS